MEEQAAGKALYRGAFSPANITGELFYNPFDFKFKNIANTGVVEWNKELLALWESDLPHALDPSTLDTKGTTRMDNTIDRDGAASAHYKIKDGRMINFGWKLSGITDMDLKIWEYASESYDVIQYSEIIVPDAAFAFLHDFVVSDNYYCFFINPCDLDFHKFVTEYIPGKTSVAQCIKMNKNKNGKWMLIPRNGKTEDTKFFEVKCSDQFIFHHANIYEEGDKVIIDSVCLEGGISFGEFGGKNMTKESFKAREYGGKGSWTGLFRHELDLNSGEVNRYRLSDRGCEFPCVNPDYIGKKYQYTYASASANKGVWF